MLVKTEDAAAAAAEEDEDDKDIRRVYISKWQRGKVEE